MTSKTPTFDNAITEYFEALQLDERGGQWRTCRFSGEKFYVRPEDVAFYKRMLVPLPTLAPVERMRRRLAYTNSYNLFRIPSAWSKKPIIAGYPEQTPYRIYEHQVWYSDVWDPLEYARSWDAETSFFEQFHTLQKDVPRPNLFFSPTNVRSDYTNTSSNLKDCYLTFNGLGGENLYYCDGGRGGGTKDAVDSNALTECDTCYRCRLLDYSHACFFCEYSKYCLESSFLFDCRNAEHCFMSYNLRNRKYVFRNEQCSPEEYRERMKTVNLGNYNELIGYVKEFEALKQQAWYRPDNNFKSVNSVGDYIETSKDCYWSQYLTDAVEVNYSIGLINYRDCYDVAGGGGGELCHEMITVSTKDNYKVKFSSQMDNCREAEYSDLCRNSSYCFGCVGLDNKSFCVFNVQYAEEEYWNLVDKIKTSMLKTGEYGEFFPPALMPVPYKLSYAASYSGMDDYENARAYGYDVSDVPSSSDQASGEVIDAKDLPVDIKDVKDEILGKTIFDSANNRYFRLMPYELEFYRRHNLALPREHPLVRIYHLRKAYPLRLIFYKRICEECGIEFTSTLDSENYKNVFCENCYNNKVT